MLRTALVVLGILLGLATTQAQDARILPHAYRGLCSFSDGTLAALRSSTTSGTRSYIQLSTNDGATWTDVLTPGQLVYSLGTSKDVLYASTSSAIYASADRGQSWEVLPLPSPGEPVELLVDDDYPLTAYKRVNTLLDRVWVYDARSNTWTEPAVSPTKLTLPHWTTDGVLVCVEAVTGVLHELDRASMTWVPQLLPPLPRQEVVRMLQFVSHVIVVESMNGTHWIYRGGEYELLAEPASWKAQLATVLHVDDRGAFFSRHGWVSRDPDPVFVWNREFLPIGGVTYEVLNLHGKLYYRVDNIFFAVTMAEVPSVSERWYWYNRDEDVMRGKSARVISSNGTAVAMHVPNYSDKVVGVSVDGGMSYHSTPADLCSDQGVLVADTGGVVMYLQADGCTLLSDDNARTFRRGETMNYQGTPYQIRCMANGSWQLSTEIQGIRTNIYTARSLRDPWTLAVEQISSDVMRTRTGDLYQIPLAFDRVDLERSTDNGATWKIAWTSDIDRDVVEIVGLTLIDDFTLGIYFVYKDGTDRSTEVYRFSPSSGTTTLFNTYPCRVTCMERSADGRLVVGCADMTLTFHNENDEPGEAIADEVLGKHPLVNESAGTMSLAIGDSYTLLTSRTGFFTLRVSEEKIVTSIQNGRSAEQGAPARSCSVAPNPSYGSVSVSTPVTLTHWLITDLLGRVVARGEQGVAANETFTVDLPTGTFVLLGFPARGSQLSPTMITVLR